MTIPPPTPVPQKTPRNESSPRPAPKRRSASTATLTSLPSRTGRPSSAASVGPSGNGASQPSMFAHLEHRARRRRRSHPARRRRCRRAPSARRRAVVERVSRGPRRARRRPPPGRPRGRLAPRGAEHACAAVRHDRLDLRAAEIEPALQSASRQPSHDLVDGLAGSPARSIPRPCALGVARPLRDSRTRARSRTSSSSAARGPARDDRASVIPFGQEASPASQAASSMLWAARPASNSTGPFPRTRIATTSPPRADVLGT